MQSARPDIAARGLQGRRGFLRDAATGLAVISGIAASACGGREGEPVRQGAPPPGAPPTPTEIDLEEATIGDLQDAMGRGLTARSLCERYLARIDELDRRGPTLRAVIETNPDALAIAERLDAERKARGPRGPLHGIPVLIKANIATADKMTTTAGSLALLGAKPPEDSAVARKLREAGAVILGKTNLSEWANFRSSRSTSGWSAQGGQCVNPYVLNRSPCGSSAGTGAGIAASLAAVGVGTETNGSIVCPASVNGLVGIKPTVGLVSRRGIVPISHTQDTAGPMARTVRDAAILLGALAGVDPKDPATQGAMPLADTTQALDASGLAGARIGIVRSPAFGDSSAADHLLDAAISALKDRGAMLVDPADIPHLGEYADAELTVLLYEFKADLNAYLAEFAPGAEVKTLEDIIAFNERNRDRELSLFDQDLMERAQQCGPLTDQAYLDALAACKRLSRDEGLDAAFAQHQVDAFLTVTTNPACTIAPSGDRFFVGSSSPAAVSGYPSITVPAGFALELPVGISFIGRRYSEATLLKLAYAFEQATKHRKAPKFLTSSSFDEC